jgi:hypothetical protein
MVREVVMTIGRVILCLALVTVGACNSPTDEGAPCGDTPYFTVLPVAPADFNAITVFGGFGAPGHVLPTAHGGMYLARTGVTLRSPGAIEVTQLRRVTYVSSPTRQGVTDFAIEYRACREVTGWFGHVASLSAAFPESALQWRNCQTYSTSDETVETCSAQPDNITFDPGEVMGTAGVSTSTLGLDVGLMDARVNNFYVSPQRHPPPTFHAICAWDQFDASSQSVLYARLFDPFRAPMTPASGTPRCGTMQVDVAGTAKGVWAEQGISGVQIGNETRYITLADYPYRPQEQLILSLGPANLGAMMGIVPRLTSGRVNRAFEQVSADGAIHCYGPSVTHVGTSWLVALAANGPLSIERRAHTVGASPCLSDPSTWSFSAARVTLVR